MKFSTANRCLIYTEYLLIGERGSKYVIYHNQHKLIDMIRYLFPLNKVLVSSHVNGKNLCHGSSISLVG